MPRARKSGMVTAREAIVINVGARAPEYEKVTVIDRRTGEPVEKNMDEPSDPGDVGIPYAFKSGEKVNRNHPAVKENPGAFVDAEDEEE